LGFLALVFLTGGFLAGAFMAAGFRAAGFGVAGLAVTGLAVDLGCGATSATGAAFTTGAKVGATCAGVSTLYGTASGCTAGASDLGSGCLNQSKIALSIDISYQVFTTFCNYWK
jgi:hypothetical protein